MRVLLLAYNEPGEISNGPAIILTRTLAALAERPGIDFGVGLLKSMHAQGSDTDCTAKSVVFRVGRRSSARAVMLRAALGGPFAESERLFLQECANHSGDYDVALWLGLSWDPVTLRLPAVCRCPVVQHPTDSITLSEINRLPGPARRLRIKLARSLETRVLRSGYASSIYNSPQDADLARSLIAETEQARIVTMPIGVDSGVFHPATSKPDRQPVRVIFSGVMNYRPNVDAALFLVREVLPLVSANIEIRLIGRNPTAALLQLPKEHAGVVVTGYVPDIAAELREADIFVAPMVSGGGISNKVLEAMASGLPVVATPLVAKSFPDKPPAMPVAATGREIASAIDMLANDRDLRLRLSAAAAEYIRAGQWSWQSRADCLIKVLRGAQTAHAR